MTPPTAPSVPAGALRDRTKAAGRCRMPSEPVVARAALHFWEEPPLRHPRGGDGVFLRPQSLGCVFCQNQAISQADFGKTISVDRLRAIFQELVAQGAHNIDLVNPTHFAHVVAQALEAPSRFLWCGTPGGYDRVETLQALEGKSTSTSRLQVPPTPQGPRPTPGRQTTRRWPRRPSGRWSARPAPASWTGMACSGGGGDPPPPPPRTAGPGQGGYGLGGGDLPPGTVLFSLMSQYTPPGAGRRRSRPWTAPCGRARSAGRRPIWPTWGWRGSPRGWRRRRQSIFHLT